MGAPEDDENTEIRSDVKETIGILNSDAKHEFWADVDNNGFVRLGKGGIIGSNIVVQWQDDDPMVPTHVGFKSGSSEAYWKFPIKGM